MYNEGDIMRNVDVVDPSSGRISQLLRRARNLMIGSTTTASEIMLQDYVILTALSKVCSYKWIAVAVDTLWSKLCGIL